jgi:hypothetical protein
MLRPPTFLPRPVRQKDTLQLLNISVGFIHLLIGSVLIIVTYVLNDQPIAEFILTTPWSMRTDKMFSVALNNNTCSETCSEISEWFACIRSAGCNTGTLFSSSDLTPETFHVVPLWIFPFLATMVTSINYFLTAFVYFESYSGLLDEHIQPYRCVVYAVSFPLLMAVPFSLYRITNAYMFGFVVIMMATFQLSCGLVQEILQKAHNYAYQKNIRGVVVTTQTIVSIIAITCFVASWVPIFKAYHINIKPYMSLPDGVGILMKQYFGILRYAHVVCSSVTVLFLLVNVLYYLDVFSYRVAEIVHMCVSVICHAVFVFFFCITTTRDSSFLQ